MATETIHSNPTRLAGEFCNEPPMDFSKRDVRERLASALVTLTQKFPVHVPLIIDGRAVDSRETIPSLDPSEFRRIVAMCAVANSESVDLAVEAARRGFQSWKRVPAEERAQVLLRAAALMRERRAELAGVEVFEAGKPWREADADVCEAIDFLEYYSREAVRLSEPHRLQPHLLGEHNDLVHLPLGVVGVIGPWNFPMAIPAGMTAAALAAGNSVVLKPAEQTPLTAYLFARVLLEAGLPVGALQFVPGRGEVCGDRLVRHPDVNMIVFTGSRQVGLQILRHASETPAGQPFVKRVVTEMGGKNAIIVDSTADIDTSVPDVLHSAFGFAGQKCSACSRLIVVRDIYGEYLKRLKDAAAALRVGIASDPATQVGPLIDADAMGKVLSYVRLGRDEAHEIFGGHIDGLLERGYFVAPHIFETARVDHPLMQEEIFGPVLTVALARDFSDALRIANSTPYALTGGVHSRTPSNSERARREFEVGNLYLNRTITGAIVGRQPFGGYRLSGTGPKAGGPDYLKQFTVARAIAENTMLQGVASLAEGRQE